MRTIKRKRRKQDLVRMLVPVLLLCLAIPVLLGGCQGAKEEEATQAPAPKTEENTGFVDEIRERGYLIAGCKTDVPGLSFYDEKTDSWSGLEVEIARKTAADIFGTDLDTVDKKQLVHFEGVTVDNREDMLLDGKVDCLLATMSITDARKKRMSFSESYYTDYVGLMVRITKEDEDSLGSGNIKSLAYLDGKLIGVARKSTTRAAMRTYIENVATLNVVPRFAEFSSYDQLYKALKRGDIDAMSVDVCILQAYKDENMKILPDRFAAQHYGAAVKPENRELLEHINKALQ